MKKQSKNFKNSEETNISPKTVAATVADGSIWDTYMMCKVRLINPDGPRKTSNALIFFDTGSDCNYVTEPMVIKLNLKQTSLSVGMLITGMVGTRKYESRKIIFGVQTLSGNVKNIQAYIVDSILERIPYVTNNRRNKLVEGVEGIADLIICNSIKRSPRMIMETKIGVVEGGTRKTTQDSDTGNRNDESYKFQTIANIAMKESQIHMDQIEETWKLEAVGIRDLMTGYQDEKALKAFQKSLTTDKEGRCVVSWPWKNQEIAPAKGYGLAWRRQRTTIRRLEKSPELLECYDEYIKTLLEERIIERIKNKNKTCPTKRGPAMMPSLVGILLRARQGRHLVIADNRKTKEVTQENLATYRFTRVSFGVVSSPFLLATVIRHLLNEESSKLSAEVAKNLCVDNVVLTARSELESNRKAQEAKELFKKAKMHLGEFHANYDIEMDSEQEITKKTATKLLGIEWNNIKD
uniref:DUF1758 domain-containing protein n=1 Tax=Loa loa TaxID=7209 RepID=A0A1I7VGP9_LOALO